MDIRLNFSGVFPVVLIACILFIPVCGEAFESVPVKIADQVLQSPGAFAWLSDKTSVAFISDELKIYDSSTGQIRSTGIKNVRHIAAGQNNILYMLYDGQGARRLSVLDTVLMARNDIPVDNSFDGIIPLPGDRGVLLITVKLIRRDLWADFHYLVSLLDIKTMKSKVVYESKRNITGRGPLTDYRHGWLWTGIRPYDSELLTVEYVRPPVVMPYLKVGLADYITGKSREMGRIEHRLVSLPVSWSPDGNRFAFPDSDSRLGIFNIQKKTAEVIPAEPVRGLYPSWNPAGSQIYFGGSIINSDGKTYKKLFDDAEGSIGLWSSDGRMLAAALKGALYLVTDVRPYLLSPDKIPDPELMKKRMLLKELLIEKLITEQEYEVRYEGLLKDIKE